MITSTSLKALMEKAKKGWGAVPTRCVLPTTSLTPTSHQSVTNIWPICANSSDVSKAERFNGVFFFRWCGTQCGGLGGAGSTQPLPGACCCSNFKFQMTKLANSQWPEAVHPAHAGPPPDPDNGAGHPEQRQHEHLAGIPDSGLHHPSAGENSL